MANSLLKQSFCILVCCSYSENLKEGSFNQGKNSKHIMLQFGLEFFFSKCTPKQINLEPMETQFSIAKQHVATRL